MARGRARADRRRGRDRADHAGVAARLAGVHLADVLLHQRRGELRARVAVVEFAGAAGTLFGSVTQADVVAAIKAAGGPTIDRRQVVLPGHIKTTGKHPVAINLHAQVEAEITLAVIAE